MKIKFTKTVKTTRQTFKPGDEADIEPAQAFEYVKNAQARKVSEGIEPAKAVKKTTPAN